MEGSGVGTCDDARAARRKRSRLAGAARLVRGAVGMFDGAPCLPQKRARARLSKDPHSTRDTFKGPRPRRAGGRCSIRGTRSR